MTLKQSLKKSQIHLSSPIGTKMYLVIDGSQIENLLQKVYALSGTIELEPLYLYPPYDHLSSVSPYLIKATQSAKEWFLNQCAYPQGYFVSSSLEISQLADHLRNFLTVTTPSGTEVFYKLGNSHAALVLLTHDETNQIWANIDECWIPTEEGWLHHRNINKQTSVYSKPLKVNEEQWEMLANITWSAALANIKTHLEKWFINKVRKLELQFDFKQWLSDNARHAYQIGFQTEKDLMLYFTIWGYIGSNDMNLSRYPQVMKLLNTNTVQTPSQRIEAAAEIAKNLHIQQVPICYEDHQKDRARITSIT